MTGNLAERRCEPCRGGTPPLGRDDARKLLSELGGGWELVNDHHLRKNFHFQEFMDAIDWVNQVAALAEEEGHHPDIHISFADVRLDIWTHKINGLTPSDFVLAAKIDALQGQAA